MTQKKQIFNNSILTDEEQKATEAYLDFATSDLEKRKQAAEKRLWSISKKVAHHEQLSEEEQTIWNNRP